MKLLLPAVLSTALLSMAFVLAADFPVPYNSDPDGQKGPLQSPAEAAAGFKMPAGFKVQVFAAEPDVQNPIAMAWDPRGRLWIAENYTYAERAKKFDLSLRDRIVILEDKDGDGKHDGRKVFTDDVQMVTSVEVGRGGVWLMAPPQVLFIPDADGDDVPDGPAQAVLDGFTVPAENYHNFANGLRWGPDGWLYGRCGASSPGRVGVPGTPGDERIPLGGGIWRFHPERKAFEVLAHGTTNPWGHDWNEYGELFFINTVNGHLWHAFPGAHFRRPHTQDPNPRVYQPIEMHADHWHWDTGKDWSDSRSATGEHDRLGGGHAHSGCTIYQGDNWPQEYRGNLFTLNFHGRRMNREKLVRHGSGYEAKHEPDLFQASDPWFRGMELSYGPDGGVFVLDWSDTGECHENTGVHRQSGRIYKITYGDKKPTPSQDLTKLDDAALVKLHAHDNEWYARQARAVLIDRQSAGKQVDGAKKGLLAILSFDKNIVHQIRALETLYALGAVDPTLWKTMMDHENEYLQAWGIRLASDHWPLDTIMSSRPPKAVEADDTQIAAITTLYARFAESAHVRLTLASLLQRMPVEKRAELAAALSGRSDDAGDHNLPLMIWYGLIPAAEKHPESLVKILGTSKMPLVRKFIARRLAEDLEKAPQHVNAIVELAAAGSPELQVDVLNGLTEGLAGWRKAPQPKAWPALQEKMTKSDQPEIQKRVRELSVLFGDGRALDEVKKIALDGKAEMNTRRAALETLIASRPDDLRAICESLLNVRFLNTTAVRGLAGFDDPALAAKLVKSYKSFHPTERPSVIETLVSRPSFAKALVEEMAQGRIARADVSPFQARQIRGFNDAELNEKLTAVWGELRDSAADKQQAITALKARLTGEVLAKGDKSAGRVVFNTACGACHRLYGHGGAIGPDLTGAGRHNIDYLLENILDPSAVVTADFRMSVVALNDGRVLNGIVAEKTDKTLTLQTAKERIAVARGEIDALEPSKLSLMPDGLLQPLTENQVRDLFAYLMHQGQAPLPAGVVPAEAPKAAP